MKKVLLVGLVIFISALSLKAQEVKVHIPLSPAGSFDAKGKVKGYVKKVKGGKFFAKNLYVVAKELKTGIDLRDEHLHERLKVKKHPKIKILKAKGAKGRGIASVAIRGVKKNIPFSYKIKGKKVNFKMDIKLTDFKFDKSKDNLSYMGIGVSDQVGISGTIPIK